MYGAFSAGVFQGIGGHFEGLRSASSTGTLSAAQTVAKIGSHAVAGGIMSSLQGGKFGHGFASAGVTQALAPAILRVGGQGFSLGGLRS